MAELLYMAIIFFSIYVVFQVVGKDEGNDNKQPETPPAPAEVPSAQPEPAKPEPAAIAPAPAAKPAKPASKRPAKTSKPATTAKPAPANTDEPAATVVSDSLKNPKTGEVAKVTGNYAFSKRWIKDALVEEGLLDKVYKNNELDEATLAKIQEALEKLKAMPKYH